MRLGEVAEGAEVSWGELRLKFTKLGEGSWRIEGSLELDVFWELDGLPVEVEPLFFEEPYFVDLVPDVVVPARSTRRLEVPIPMRVKVKVGGSEIGEFSPTVKRAYLGPTNEGRFAIYVVPQNVEPPLAYLWADVVNDGEEKLLLDELTVNPASLSLFFKDGSWVTDLVKVYPRAQELEVRPTGFGEGEKIVEGKPEPEVFTRFKRLALKIKNAVA